MLGAQVLALVAFSVFYLVRLLRHEGNNQGRVAMSIVLLLIVALLLLLLARGMAAGRDWARTPTLVWQALLLPIAAGMFQSDRADLGTVVVLVSIAGIVGVIRQPREPDALS